MKYALVLRKLLYNNTIYYQVIDKVIGEESFNNRIKVIEGDNYLEKELPSIEEKNSDYSYLEIDEQAYNEFNMEEFIFYKLENKNIINVDDPLEYNNIILAFHNKYQDFQIIPEYNIGELLDNTKKELKNKIMGQDKSINKILRKIYDNYMYFNSDLTSDNIYKYKNNIMIIGEIGTGKTTIGETLINNLYPIPVVSCNLTGDVNEDIAEIVRKLWIISNGNKYLAERGIVLFDSIDSLGEFDNIEDVKLYINELETLIKSRSVYLRNKNDEIIEFDYSLVTNILMLDMEYDFTEVAEYDDLYYSKVYGSKLQEMGFNQKMINDLFNNEVIFLNEMTEELAISILKNKEISPLYQMKKVLESNGKKVRISKDFVETLVDYSLDFNEGFSGVIKTLKYLFEVKDKSLKEIVFNADDVFNLKVGTVNLFHDEDFDEFVTTKEEEKDDKKDYKIKGLDVNIKNRTINNLKVSDTVDLIKKQIKGQDDSIFSVVNSFYNHIFNQYRGYTKAELRELKENVLIFGSTGVGKTAIVKSLANIFKIPFVREIASRYSKAGYVGESVDSVLYDLVDAAHGDIEAAEHGILYIDEIDKIKFQPGSGNADSMSEGVQYNLLTLIEGDKRTVEGNMTRPSLTFDTSYLWVVGSGAFDGLEDYIKERLKKERGLGKVGFGEKDTDLTHLPLATDDDLHSYGMDRQFLGRFPNKTKLDNLNVDILYDIIVNNDKGIVSLTKKGYESDGIKVLISEEFKRNLAKKAYDRKQGARGIHSAFIEYKNAIDKVISDGDIEEIILDKECVDSPEQIIYVKRKK